MQLPAQNPRFPLSDLPGSLPHTPLPGSVDEKVITENILKGLFSDDPTCFAEDAFWRDMFALTDNMRTFYGAETIKRAWGDCYKLHKPVGSSVEIKLSHVTILGPMQWIQVHFTFHTDESPVRRCFCNLRIVYNESKEWKVWVLGTMLEEIDGLGHPDKLEPVASASRTSTNNSNDTAGPYDVLVVGAGPGGLSVAGRLKAMGLNALTVERNAALGDNWLQRYSFLHMHTPRNVNVLPLSSAFRAAAPYFVSREDLAAHYQDYADRFALNVWLRTTLLSAAWDASARQWTATLARGGATVAVKASHLVLAVGRSMEAVKPEYANAAAFRGAALHSIEFSSAAALRREREAGGAAPPHPKAIVVGTANTAHDVAEDLLSAGYEVLMVQRRVTPIVRAGFLSEIFDHVYRDGVDSADADRANMLAPLAVTRKMAMGFIGAKFAHGPDRDLLDGLEKAGFGVQRQIDIFSHVFEKKGCHYVDIGASQKIVDGKIRVKSGIPPTEWVENGLRFEDGTVEEADVVVFATGFVTDSRKIVEKIVGEKIAAELPVCDGVDAEGEIRGVWTPTGGE